MRLRNDAILLSGFIYGTSSNMPSAIREAIKRVTDYLISEEPAPGTDRGDEVAEHSPLSWWSNAQAAAADPKSDHMRDTADMVKPADTAAVDHIVDADKLVEPEPKKEKRKCNFSPEQREAAAQRMRDMQACKRAEREAGAGKPPAPPMDEEYPGVPAAPPPKPFTPVSADKLQHEHSEYAGIREDRTLVDEDWGDIKKMRANGLPDERIIKNYGIDVGYFIRFVHKMEQQDKARAGNF